MSDALLEIRVGLTDGSRITYTQDDPKLVHVVLGRIQPDRLFAQPTIVIGGDHHVSVFPSARVAHLEVRCEELPEWSFGTNFERLVLLDDDLFRRRLQEIADVQRKDQHIEPGSEVIGYARLESLGGHVYRVGIHARALPVAVRATRIARILELPVMHVRRGENAAVLVNLHNVVSLRVYPGMPETPPNALEAHEKTVPEGERWD